MKEERNKNFAIFSKDSKHRKVIKKHLNNTTKHFHVDRT